jgi:UDP-N-acetylmuramyl pentapeptide synthase
MRKMINNTIQLRNQLFSDRALIYCLGDMRELGEFTEQEHKQLASLIAQSADRVYLLGDSMQSRMVDELVKVGFNQQKIYLFDDSVSLGKQLKSDLLELDQQAVILCK